MIPIELWLSEPMAKRRQNAVAKALKEQPSVEMIADGEDRQFYKVKGQYEVQVYQDADSQLFVSCSCVAGSPPIDPDTNLPKFESVPCFHIAATLHAITQKDLGTKE